MLRTAGELSKRCRSGSRILNTNTKQSANRLRRQAFFITLFRTDQIHVGWQRLYGRLRCGGPRSTPSGLGLVLNCMLLMLNPFGVLKAAIGVPLFRMPGSGPSIVRWVLHPAAISLRSLRNHSAPCGLVLYRWVGRPQASAEPSLISRSRVALMPSVSSPWPSNSMPMYPV